MCWSGKQVAENKPGATQYPTVYSSPAAMEKWWREQAEDAAGSS